MAAASLSAQPATTVTDSPTPTVSPIVTDSSTPTSTATPTASPSATATGTSTPTLTTTPFSDHLLVTVYNAAAESMVDLYNGSIDAIPASVSLSASSFTLGSGSVVLTVPGQLFPPQALVWDGKNSGGVLVVPGPYYFKALVTDEWAAQTSFVIGVQALGTPTPTATETSTPPPSATVTTTATPSMTPTASHSPSATPNLTQTSIALSATPTPAFARNGQGLSVVAGPVPAKRGQPLCLYFAGAPGESSAELYDVTGGRVASQNFGAQVAPCLSTQSLAPGLYLLRLKADGQERWQKVAIVP